MRNLLRPHVGLPTIIEIQGLGTAWMQGSGSPPADGKWNQPDVRGALYAMHGRGCAYCQRDLLNDRGAVEHFRPQSLYPWLKYNFENYLLSCDTCNSGRKVGKFPLVGDVPPFDFTRSSDLADEPRLILDPVFDGVESSISFDVDDPLCPVIVISPPSSTASQRDGYTIDFFELDVNQRLIKSRVEIVNRAIEALNNVKFGDGSRRMELRKSASRYQPHGIAVRALLEKYAAELLPTQQEEVFWLIDEYLGDLTRIDSIRPEIRGAGPLRRLDREEAECCYALAILIKDPPAASSTGIAQYVEQAGRTAQVKHYLDMLS